MHGTTLPGTQRARRTSAGNLRTRALKNWLARHRTAGRRTHSDWYTGLRWGRSNDSWRRSLVDRTRACLRHNHARRRRLRRTGHDGCSGTRRCWWSLRRGRSCNRRRSWRGRRNRGRRRRCRTRRSHDRRRGWGCRRCGHCGTFRWRSHNCRTRCGRRRSWSRGYGRRWRRRWPSGWRRDNGLRCHWRDRRTRGRSDRFLLLRNGLQHVSGTGDVRQVDLGLNFFFAAQWARGSGRRGLCFGRAANVLPHLFRFMFLERTGMGLLLRHSDER
jgi:hypothetical protein